jgi:toxin FitB
MFLCDTNIISELARPRPNTDVTDWIANLEMIYISVISLEEIQFGIAARSNERLQNWFEQFIEMDCIILPVSEPIAIRAGQMRGDFRRTGTQRTQADILIAATALHHEFTLATRNVKDFEDCNGLMLFNPFTSTE